jgi:hypothetical protein
MNRAFTLPPDSARSTARVLLWAEFILPGVLQCHGQSRSGRHVLIDMRSPHPFCSDGSSHRLATRHPPSHPLEQELRNSGGGSALPSDPAPVPNSDFALVLASHCVVDVTHKVRRPFNLRKSGICGQNSVPPSLQSRISFHLNGLQITFSIVFALPLNSRPDSGKAGCRSAGGR